MVDDGHIVQTKAQADVNYRVFFYINNQYKWLNIDEINQLTKDSEYIQNSVDSHNDYIGAFGFKDLGKDQNGLTKFAQMFYDDGIGGTPEPRLTTFSVMHKNQAKNIILNVT